MKRIHKLINLVKDITSSFINSEDVNSEKIESYFDKESAKELIDRLKSPEEQRKRILIANKIEKEKNKGWNKIKKEINPTPKIYYLKRISKVAAIIIGLIGVSVSYFIYNDKPSIPNENISFDKFDKKEIVLKLANGDTQIISANGESKIIDNKGNTIGAQEGNKLSYQNVQNTNKELIYNELIVPYGKTFQLVLSDGTMVHLNAGTTLKYPINFLKEKNRQVYLLGEAYFKVSKDEKNPFIVHTNDLNIRVLGTGFNVSSYPEDKNILTVLVEGSVGLYGSNTPYTKENSTLLTPGKRAKWKKSNQKITINKVNTSIYTSWIEGKLIIENLKFRQIIKKLQRHYNVTIINNNEQLANQIFTATFKVENIQEVLKSFQTNFPFEYKIENDKIIIN